MGQPWWTSRPIANNHHVALAAGSGCFGSGEGVRQRRGDGVECPAHDRVEPARKPETCPQRIQRHLSPWRSPTNRGRFQGVEHSGIGIGTSGSFLDRGAYHVAATRWRIPLGFPLAREVADHNTMDGLGSCRSFDRIGGICRPIGRRCVLGCQPFRVCPNRARKSPLGTRGSVAFP